MASRVLGIDVASVDWSSVGSAVIDFDTDDQAFIHVVPGVIDWPSGPLTPQALADAIDAFVREYGVLAVALDGPQGWRDPDTSLGAPGVGRRCEYRCRTQGKTGVYPKTYPSNQRPWIEFSIELFARLLAKPGVDLADSADWKPSSDYALLECFPTSAWRSSGLAPLPGKSRNPRLTPYAEALTDAYQLPAFEAASHDDLQAVVAALTAVGALRGPAVPIPEGKSSALIADAHGTRRVEGLIWNVRPIGRMSARETGKTAQLTRTTRDIQTKRADRVYVTQRVLDQVSRMGDHQMQVTVSRELGGTRLRKVRVRIETENDRFDLIAGDTHVIWRSNQNPETLDSFERLFALLSDQPDRPLDVNITLEDVQSSSSPSEVLTSPPRLRSSDWRELAEAARRAGALLRQDRQQGEARFEELLARYPGDGMLFLERGRARAAVADIQGATSDFVTARRNLPLAQYRQLADDELRRLQVDGSRDGGAREPAGVLAVPSAAELRRAHELFTLREKRSVDFEVAARLLDQALSGTHLVSATLPSAMLLQSWNFAYYQDSRAFDLNHYACLDEVLSRNRNVLTMFRKRHLRDLEDSEEHVVGELFNALAAVVGKVGAAKVLHLWAPEFFPLWDNPIATGYGYELRDPAADYWLFMRVVRSQVESLTPPEGVTALKALDEYNYCRFTKNWIGG